MSKLEQVSFFDLELPSNDYESVSQIVKNNQPTATTISEQKTAVSDKQHFNFARVPDEEYTAPPKIIGSKPTVDDILRLLDKGTYKVGRHEFLSDLFEMSAIAISNQFDFLQAEEREKTYVALINKYDKGMQQLIVQTFDEIYKLLSNQYNPVIGFADYLGEIYMKSETSSSKSGQFFTPYNLSKLCAKCSLNEVAIKEAMEQDKIIKLHEPTCGSGGMIIAVADVLYNDYHFNISRNLLVECGDIDKRCVRMSYLQLSLAGIPAVIFQRDGITLETWERWETPAYIMNYSRFKNAFKKLPNDWQKEGK